MTPIPNEPQAHLPGGVTLAQAEWLHKQAITGARRSLLAFTAYTMPGFHVSWHHVLLAEYLEKWADGRIRDLIVSMPPRHTKSELASRRLPAWMLGRNPNLRVIGASYGADLAIAMCRDVQRIIDTEEYRRIFPQTTLNASNVKAASKGSFKRTADQFEIVGASGGYIGRGVGGGLTGMGAHRLIIDDPIKDRKEADSPTYRDAVWDWYTQVFSTRRIGSNAGRLVIMTRWHEDDLAGRILRGAASESWEVLSLPAIAEGTRHPRDPRKPGEALWSRYPLAYLKEMREEDPRGFDALFQGRPTSEAGNVFQRAWMERRWSQLPPFNTLKFIQSWDMSFGSRSDSASYVVGQVWAKHKEDLYLVDQIRERADYNRMRDMVREMSRRWPMAYEKVIEKKANGAAIMDDLRTEIGGLIPEEVTGGDKVARAQACTPMFRSGNVILPASAPWLGAYIEELASFPFGANDDQVDATSQAIKHLRPPPASIWTMDKLG